MQGFIARPAANLSAASGTLRRAAFVIILLLASGILLRLWLANRASLVDPVSDMKDFLQLAESISGKTLTHITDRPFVYPLMLAGAYRLGIQDLRSIYLVQAALSLLTLIPTCLIARELGGPSAGWICLGLAAPQLTLAQYSSLLLTENLFLPLFAVWVLLSLGPSRAPVRIFFAGLAAGLGVATRPASVFLVMGTILSFITLGKDRVRTVLIFVVAAVIGSQGSLFLFEAVTGVPAKLMPTAGVNLYLGNSAQTDWSGGGREELPDNLLSVDDPGIRNHRAMELAIDFMVGHPVRTITLAVIRAIRLTGFNPGRHEHDALVKAGMNSRWVIGWLGFEWLGVVFTAALAIPSSPRVSPKLKGLLMTTAPYLLMLTITFVQTRFRLPCHLLLTTVSAVGITDCVNNPHPVAFLRSHSRSLLAAAGALSLGGGFTLVEWFTKR